MNKYEDDNFYFSINVDCNIGLKTHKNYFDEIPSDEGVSKRVETYQFTVPRKYLENEPFNTREETNKFTYWIKKSLIDKTLIKIK